MVINISQVVLEDRIQSLAKAHNRLPEDIVAGALATALGAPEVLLTLNFQLPYAEEYDMVMPVPA